jgi:alkaline phosphatase D
MMNMDFSRRTLMGQAAWIAGASLLPAWSQPVLARTRFSGHPFTLGVASGDPAPDGMVLWTRLAPDAMTPDGGMPPEAVAVGWEIADDAGFRSIVRSGQVLARPQAAHSVHVEVEGLRPGRDYFYRFHAGTETSPVGRTRTSPRPGDDVQALRYAFTACQRYENGYYAGYRQMVADDPAVIFFLGDYIYEQAARDGLPRRHNDEAATDLASYRRRHSLYKLDPDLQAAHAAAPWMAIWDDHEVQNNYSNDLAAGHQTRAEFLQRRAAAYQAYFEHMPMRRRAMPVGPSAEIYRTLDWGRLAQFQLIDCRQFRSDPPCADPVTAACAARLDPALTLLGAKQEAWLMDRLGSSTAKWNVLTQQFMMAEARRPDPKTGETTFSTDGWDGYPDARDRVLTRWRDSKVSNPMAIGGDSHAFIASDLGIGPDGPVIAPAFVGGSMSSTSGPEFPGMVANSPRVRFGASERRGYTLVETTPRQSLVTMRATEDATRSDTTTTTLKRFVVEDGVPGFREA